MDEIKSATQPSRFLTFDIYLDPKELFLSSDALEDGHNIDSVLIATGEVYGDESNVRGEERKRD